MRAITVIPKQHDSAALVEVPEPAFAEGNVLVETLAIGICGTDVEIIRGKYGWAPAGETHLVLGHESLGRVLACPAETSLQAGDLVVGIVRHPDPVPCPNCAVGEWDMCRNGQYTEHGIKELHGFAREHYRTQVDRVVKVDAALGKLGVLLEPTSVLAKAWEHIELIGNRAHWEPRTVLITGAGPIGLLGALMARQRGFETTVVDIVSDGPKPQLVRDLGAHYYAGKVTDIPCGDIVLECTGVAQLVFDVMRAAPPNGIICLTGVSSGGRKLSVDLGEVNRSMVLENNVVFGSVNANRRHYELAAEALAKADKDWLSRLITRWVPLENWSDALERRPHDVKTVIEFQR